MFKHSSRSLIERAERKPSVNVADSITQGLGVSLSEMIKEAEAFRKKTSRETSECGQSESNRSQSFNYPLLKNEWRAKRKAMNLQIVILTFMLTFSISGVPF